jgi:hypothetical protein
MTSFSFSRRDLMVGGLSSRAYRRPVGLTACSPQDRKPARLSKT